MLEALINTFAQLEDPRCDWRVEHKLLDILVIAVCAVIGEAESFEDIALYGRCKRDWLGRFLELPGGIPSHDTFRRVLMLIDPECFERCFLDWVRSVFRPAAGAPRQIAIDGKTVRRSFDRQNGRSLFRPELLVPCTRRQGAWKDPSDRDRGPCPPLADRALALPDTRGSAGRCSVEGGLIQRTTSPGFCHRQGS